MNMILDTMDLFEMRRYLRPTVIELYSYVVNVVSRLLKDLKKGQKLTVTKKKRVNGIDWYLALFILKDKKLEKPAACSFYCILRNIKGQDYVLCYNISYNSIIKLSMHFFKRYRERYLKDENLSLKDTIKIFFERNPTGRCKTIPTGYISECPDGICISNDKRRKVHNNFGYNQITSFNTFLTREMLNKGQGENFLSLTEEELQELDPFNMLKILATETREPY